MHDDTVTPKTKIVLRAVIAAWRTSEVEIKQKMLAQQDIDRDICIQDGWD